MKISLALLCAARLILGVDGAPGPVDSATDKLSGRSHNGGKKFTLSEIHNERFKPIDGPTALLRAHARYSSTLPPTLMKAVEINPDLNSKFKSFFAQDTGTGSVVALPAQFYDSEYVVPVKIGTPPQTTYLDLDTGSSDLWVFSSQTFPFEANGHPLYRPEDSSTSQLLRGESWVVKYGDGAGAGGTVYKDKVSVGAIAVQRQAVQAAVTVSSDISGDIFSSGILGMASSSVNTVRPTQQLTFLANIQHQLAIPLFTVDLQKGKPGSYNFGYIDTTRFTGNIKYTEADVHSPFWMITVDGFQVGQNRPYHPQKWNGIVDTGTSLLLAPGPIVDAYYSQVSGAGIEADSGMVVFPCKSFLQDFIFGIGEYRGVIPGQYMNYAESNETHCYGGIQTSEGIGFSVLGDILLKAQFVVFDLERHDVGFANKHTLS